MVRGRYRETRHTDRVQYYLQFEAPCGESGNTAPVDKDGFSSLVQSPSRIGCVAATPFGLLEIVPPNRNIRQATCTTKFSY